MAARFERCRVHAVYELPKTQLRELMEKLRQFGTQVTQTASIMSSSFPEGQKVFGTGAGTIPSTDLPGLTGTFGGIGGTNVTIAMDTTCLTGTNWHLHLPSMKGLKPLTDFLSNPTLTLDLYSRDTSPGREEPDFHVGSPELEAGPSLEYLPAPDVLLVKWRLNYPHRNWEQTKKMAALQDLSEARLTVFFKPLISGYSDAMRPVQIDIVSDKAALSLTSFQKVPTSTGGTGSGKSSGSGATIAKAYLRNGFGGIVTCCKPGDADT
jgi:hypothetical protein